MRSGLITQKVGMSRIFQKDGTHIPVTVLKIDNLQVVAHRCENTDGYNAIQLGYGKAKDKHISKPMRHHFKKKNVGLKKKLAEFRISKNQSIDIGKYISADHFVIGQYVDVTGTSIGKGFAGPMKRHNFRGLRASHGVSVSHRAHGSTGQCQDPGRVFKGKKMAGHLGSKQVTIQSLKLADIDTERNLLLVKGSVPGHKGSYILVKDSIKRK